MKSKQNIYKKGIEFKIFCSQFRFSQKETKPPSSKRTRKRQIVKKPRKNFTLTNEEHIENIDKIKLKDLDIM